MKAVIVLPGLPQSAPYIGYYIDIFNDLSIDYLCICWNRNGYDVSSVNNLLIFNYTSKEKENFLRKIIAFWAFSKFVKRHLKKIKCDFMTVHTLSCAIYLKTFLKRRKYILDIRDYSPMVPYFRKTISIIIKNSMATAISSDAYKTWLPKKYNYIISHNISKHLLPSKTYVTSRLFENESIEVLTIGQIRDFSSNSALIKSLGDKASVRLKFVGEGTEAQNLRDFSRGYSNIVFCGRYDKLNEPELVNNCDIINILLPNRFETMTQMTNRFYLGLIFKKPILVDKASIQSHFVNAYNLGIVVDRDDNIYEKIMEYRLSFDKTKFILGCEELLRIIEKDILSFEFNIKNNILK